MSNLRLWIRKGFYTYFWITNEQVLSLNFSAGWNLLYAPDYNSAVSFRLSFREDSSFYCFSAFYWCFSEVLSCFSFSLPSLNFLRFISSR